ncbi:uncharacterized protein LOC118242606 isoform X4 [Electrophorus electricus]|uniref:uncharacterized protein LOC118242606 isoform X4 n=1 Tax=Electrophorus electricus TaxID=8005 RepID=UPI0015D02B2D|nr:uncharacterized protein LOC118242606 isoform X4 [Electrophorus electricus]
MKTFVSLSCTLLSAAVGSMLCAQIRKTGTEGNVAVIQCPYAKGYEAYLKYFCKGTYKDCVSVVKTDGKEPWAFQGRFSLHDNTEKKMFVVTITALRIEDTGQYCCGIESVGSDPFTVVQLTLLRLHNLNPHPSPLLHSTPTPLKCENVCEHTGLSLSTNGTGNATETGNSTQPSGTFIYAGGVFITVLLVLPITSGIFFALRCRADKSLPNSQENMENFPLYEEMQQSDPTHTNVSVSTNQGPVPPTDNAMTTHQHSDPPPACSTIYTQQMKSANERQDALSGHLFLCSPQTPDVQPIREQTPQHHAAHFLKSSDLTLRWPSGLLQKTHAPMQSAETCILSQWFPPLLDSLRRIHFPQTMNHLPLYHGHFLFNTFLSTLGSSLS